MGDNFGGIQDQTSPGAHDEIGAKMRCLFHQFCCFGPGPFARKNGKIRFHGIIRQAFRDAFFDG